MKRKTVLWIPLIFFALFTVILAQNRLPVREYTAPEQLISITGDTPFDKAMNIFSNAFKRFEQKPLVYDGKDSKPIGINIPNMFWRDAFELVLRVNNNWYIENPEYVRVYALSVNGQPESAPLSTQQAVSTREVEISAIFFEANRSRMEQLGIDWSLANTTPTTTASIGVTNFGAFQKGTGTGTGSGSSQGEGTMIEYGLNSMLDAKYKAANLLAALKAIQTENLGELISAPSITVRSGETGRIQVGQDFSIKQKDFAGNTTEKFYSAGTIIDVTPEIMIHDSLEFVHLKIQAERSSVFPDPISTIINKTSANTSVILIDQEETVVGGLYTNDVQQIRRGVPYLKDLPWWFFGLRYLFGYDDDQITKKELIIILKARIMPSIEQRVTDKLTEIKQGQRVLQNEYERQEETRRQLIEQIEAAKSRR